MRERRSRRRIPGCKGSAATALESLGDSRPSFTSRMTEASVCVEWTVPVSERAGMNGLLIGATLCRDLATEDSS